MDTTAENGGTSEKADDDPGGRRLESAPTTDNVPESFFDLTIFDQTRVRAAYIMPPLIEGRERLWHWSEAGPLLLSMSREERFQLAEFMAPRLQAAYDVHPAEIWTREEFLERAMEMKTTHGSQLIICGIDGMVDEPSWQARFGTNGDSRQVLNIDHHRGATPETPSTAVQKLRWLLNTFRRKRELGDDRPLDVRLLANDPDQDVCATVALARHLPRILRLQDRELQEVAEYLCIQDLLDRFAAMVPVNPESAHLRWNAHINQPYTEARRASAFNLPSNPTKSGRAAAAGIMIDIIEEVSSRLGAFVDGERTTRDISTHVAPLYEKEDWCLIDESDQNNGEWSAVGALHRGKQLLVKARPAHDRFIYSYNLVDPRFLSNNQRPLNLHLPSFLAQMQVLDPQAYYGGSQRCGGCRAGSMLHPDEMVKRIERCLESQSDL